MSMQILVTNGGPHPPEKWAHVSAHQIMDVIQVAPSAPKWAFRAHRELEIKLYELLVRLHDEVQRAESDRLKTDDVYLNTPIAPHVQAFSAASKVVEAAQDSAFADHFSAPQVKEYIMRVIGQHFTDAMHIERRWHVDRNPNSEHAKAYRAKHNMG
jgi:hypothetical protein